MYTNYYWDQRTLVTSPDRDRSRVEASYLRYAGVGVEFCATITALTLLGLWLDDRFHTAPALTIVLAFVGFVAASWNLVHSVLRDTPPTHKPDLER